MTRLDRAVVLLLLSIGYKNPNQVASSKLINNCQIPKQHPAIR